MNANRQYRPRPRPSPLALTEDEASQWRLFVGVRAPLPRSAEAMAARLERQARELEAGGTPDERLAAMLAREFAEAVVAARAAAMPGPGALPRAA